MNLLEQQPPLLLLPQPLGFTACQRHPDQNFTSFCASCLRERLTFLEASTPTSTTLTALSALKAIFQRTDKNNALGSSSSSELRRSKSFSGGKGEGFSGILVPQRKSCDARGRSSLGALFNQDDQRNVDTWGDIEVEPRELGYSGVLVDPVEEEGDEEEEDIRELNPNDNVNVVEEIVKQDKEEKPIELDSHIKKPIGRDLKEIAGSFWVAASVFSKKLQKWRRKQKAKKSKGDGSSFAMHVDKPYSEIADYGFGRRSIDIDPRYSLDAGRMSFDDPWDAPRASWDGHLTGRTFPRVPLPMVSLVENLPVSVPRFDTIIPVEEPRISVTEDAATPGGSAQTRDYYSSGSFTSQKRRKSFERSNSFQNKVPAVVADLDHTNLVLNTKVSPATLETFTAPKLLVTDNDLRSSKSNSLRDDCPKSFESAFRDAASVTSGLERKGSRKSHPWSKAWSIWGLIIRRAGSKDNENGAYSRGSMAERSLSESWPELQRHPNGALNRVLRSNSSVSFRSSFGMSRSFSSTRKNAAKTNGHGSKKWEEHMLDKNRSARYSSNDVDNGLLRFYLAPMKNGRRNGSTKSMPKYAHSMASKVTRFY